MDLNNQNMLEFEDGASIWFAIHEQVTNLPRLIDLIQRHKGTVVSDIGAADFCLLSACRPDANEKALCVSEEGGLAIDASWIWESAALGRLLPWYKYQLGNANRQPEMDDEERDLHELSICLARYLPIAGSIESIYAHLAMKFPHHTAAGFKELHEQHQQAVDSCVLNLAHQINAITPPVGFFSSNASHTINTNTFRNEYPLSSPSDSVPHDSSSANTHGTGSQSESAPSTSRSARTIGNRITELHNVPGHVESATPQSAASDGPHSGGSSLNGTTSELAPVRFNFDAEDVVMQEDMVTSGREQIVSPPNQRESTYSTHPSSIHRAAASRLHESPQASSSIHAVQPQITGSARLAVQGGGAEDEHSASSGSGPRLSTQPFGDVEGLSSHDPVVPSLPSTKRKRGRPPKITTMTTISAAKEAAICAPYGDALLRRSHSPGNQLQYATLEDSSSDDADDSGEYTIHPPELWTKGLHDSGDGEKRRRRKEKGKRKEKQKERGGERKEQRKEQRSRSRVLQHEINAMLEWVYSHPVNKERNKLAYWQKFVEESEIGKTRSSASWLSTASYYCKTPSMEIGDGVTQPTAAGDLPALPSQAEASPSPKILLKLPPANNGKRITEPRKSAQWSDPPTRVPPSTNSDSTTVRQSESIRASQNNAATIARQGVDSPKVVQVNPGVAHMVTKDESMPPVPKRNKQIAGPANISAEPVVKPTPTNILTGKNIKKYVPVIGMRAEIPENNVLLPPTHPARIWGPSTPTLKIPPREPSILAPVASSSATGPPSASATSGGFNRTFASTISKTPPAPTMVGGGFTYGIGGQPSFRLHFSKANKSPGKHGQ